MAVNLTGESPMLSDQLKSPSISVHILSTFLLVLYGIGWENLSEHQDLFHPW